MEISPLLKKWDGNAIASVAFNLSRSSSEFHKPAYAFCHADLSSGSPGHVFPSALQNSG
jgi:hypothetical protein